MTEIEQLLKRIDAEFIALDDRNQKNHVEYRNRKKRLEQFGTLLDELHDIWIPRIEALRQRFGARVKVTPRCTPSRCEATFEMQSFGARVRLRLALFADRDVKHVQLASDLDIVPMLLPYAAPAEVAFPLHTASPQTLTAWIDDQIVQFVRIVLECKSRFAL